MDKLGTDYFTQLFIYFFGFVVIQLLSCFKLFATPWTAECQASLSFTISRSLLKLMSIESMMQSNHDAMMHHDGLY